MKLCTGEDMLGLEQTGNPMSYAQVLENFHDIDSQQLKLAHAEIEKSRQEAVRQQAEILELRIALAVLAADKAGLRAQALALKAELERIDPENALFAATGKVYKTGTVQNALKVIYDETFDTKAQELNLLQPQRFRPVTE